MRMWKLTGVLLGLCLIEGAVGFYEQVFGPKVISAAARPPPTGPPPICIEYNCMNYHVITRDTLYEHRRYDGMRVAVAEDSETWMSNLINYNKFRYYFEEGFNSASAVLQMTFPVLTPVNSSSKWMTIMALPRGNASAVPPRPLIKSIRFDTLPAMNVYVRTYNHPLFGSDHPAAVAEFKRILGNRANLASAAAFVAEYNHAYEMFDRRAEIWLVAGYPSRRQTPFNSIPNWF